ncbi:MAG: NADH-quinone oxidoreductase subunit M [Acidobacteria bacterium]|nr:NADH-quinone oxidoreductase subunit M [Acidobacteriota bacterium]
MKIGILSWVTWLPALGAILLLLFNKSKNDAIRWFANLWMGLCFVVSIPLITGFGSSIKGYDRALGGLQFIEDFEWIPIIGTRYQVAVDGLSVILIMLTTLLGVIAAVCSWSYIRDKGREKEYYIMLLLLQTGMIGAFASADLFLFFIFWEVMLVPMYFLIGIWGGKNRLYSAIKFFLYTLVGSVVMLLAVLKLFFIFPDVVKSQKGLVLETARQYATNHETGQENSAMRKLVEDAMRRVDGKDVDNKSLPSSYVRSSFNIAALTAIGPHIKTVFGINVVIWLFVGFALSFAIKVPMFPFHTWLPDAHYDAPTAGSVILAGILLKMGTYGFMRFSLPIFPDAATHPRVRFWMITLAIIGIIYGALVAMAQKDIKKLVAYSSVSHLGFVMLGLFALNPNGINGAVMQMINHGISTGALFMLAGLIYERRHTYEIAEFGGLASVMPIYSTIFLIVTLSSLGLPLMNNFIGEFLVLRGAFEAKATWGALATVGIILGAAYMLWLYQRVFFGAVTNDKNKTLPDLNAREAWQFAPLIVLIFWIGIYPKPLLSYINPQTEAVVVQIDPNYFKLPEEPKMAEEKSANELMPQSTKTGSKISEPTPVEVESQAK